MLATLLLGGISSAALGQETNSGESDSPNGTIERTVRVFLDCQGCDESYIRRNLGFVDYVRNRQQADVHVMGTIQRTGGGGRSYRLRFIGRGPFAGTEFELGYSAAQTMTQDEIRAGLVERLRLGLAPFVGRSPEADRVAVTYDAPADTASGQRGVEDPWNHWVFQISGSGDVETEASQSEFGLEGQLEAERITEAWKLRFGYQSEYDRDTFDRDEERIVSVRRSHDFDADVVKSIGDHYAVGLSQAAYSSTFSNIRFATWLRPAAEYNVFPYRISDQKELTFTYRVGPEYRTYNDSTIFNKKEQFVAEQSLDVSLDMNRPWGRLFASLQGSHYFYDLSKNRVQFFSWVNVQLVEGLSLRLQFSVERIRDQISLPRGRASLEEVLLRRQELATDYELGASIGLSYTFGSIYNNVVNTRL